MKLRTDTARAFGALTPRSARRTLAPFRLSYFFHFRGDETFLNGMSGKGRGDKIIKVYVDRLMYLLLYCHQDDLQ